MNLILTAVFIGTMTVTSYRSVPNQTDSSPWITSIGERVHPHGIAVSRDLLKKNGGPINYGDEIYVEGFGFKVVNDTMNKRYKSSVDIWVRTYAEEKKVGVQNRSLWLIKSKEVSVCQPAMKRRNIFVRAAAKLLGALLKTIS